VISIPKQSEWVNQEIIRTIVKSRFRRVAKFAANLLPLAAIFLSGNNAQAHLTYSGRDLGVFSGLTNASATITNQTVIGNYGWADAADGVLGDSHRGRAFRFRLDNPAFVNVTVSANPNATTNSLGDLTPAFSVYSGFAAISPFPPTQTDAPSSADHDGTPASIAWRTLWVKQHLDPEATDEAPTDGCWNALGDFKIGGDGDLAGDISQLSTLTYKGAAAATTGRTVTGSLSLPAGDYTIIVGGNDLANKTANTAASARGISLALTVTPTPVLGITAKVFVALPTGSTRNWKLQTASSAGGTDWKDVTTAAVTVDGQAGVVVDAAIAQQFFRLVTLP
jgi:hypothetical protein